MLRANARQAVLEVIENSYFGSTNFIVDFGSSSSPFYSITFIPDKRFSFTLSFAPNENPFTYRTKECPSENFLTPQNYHFNVTNEALSRLNSWLDRVREELISTNPFAREISELRAQVEQRISQFEQNLDEFFSIEEARTLQERLNELAEKITSLQDANMQMESDIDGLKKTIEDLKDASTVVNKGTWYRMASGRLLSGMKALAKSKEARELAVEAAKKFLLEGPK